MAVHKYICWKDGNLPFFKEKYNIRIKLKHTRSCSQGINVLLSYRNHTHKLDRNFLWITNRGLILTRLYLFKSQGSWVWLLKKANYQKISSCRCHSKTDTEDSLAWFQGSSWPQLLARQANQGPLETPGCILTPWELRLLWIGSCSRNSWMNFSPRGTSEDPWGGPTPLKSWTAKNLRPGPGEVRSRNKC